jgi:hypothetical protein
MPRENKSERVQAWAAEGQWLLLINQGSAKSPEQMPSSLGSLCLSCYSSVSHFLAGPQHSLSLLILASLSLAYLGGGFVRILGIKSTKEGYGLESSVLILS